ncbi:hypothetical protein [Coleofasciculus sp. G1-WW12-02]|uniref:hypothetical protein n=1 Tax=Coleofasciculus sp. G1-WW12-02 TaxID=3068483 RepID=UPI0040636F83
MIKSPALLSYLDVSILGSSPWLTQARSHPFLGLIPAYFSPYRTFGFCYDS